MGLVVGNPYNLNSTVIAGIINKSRKINILITDNKSVIQTIFINSGNLQGTCKYYGK